MNWIYWLGQKVGRFILFCTIRQQVIRPGAVPLRGPLLLALTHLSHLEPILLSILVDRPIDWMARIEFFKYRWSEAYLHSIGAFKVRRFGVPVSAIREAIRRLEKGRLVGICPEAGVSQGPASCLRGGPFKKGVCLISYRTGIPVLPCVMLGTDKLNCVGPWLPFRRGRLWVAFGDAAVFPRRDLDRRTARQIMADELSRQYQRLFRELLETFHIPEESVP